MTGTLQPRHPQRPTPVCILAAQRLLASASAVLFGRYGDVTQLAHEREVCRQALYRESARVLDAVDGSASQQRLHELADQAAHQRQHTAELEQRLADAVIVDADKQAEFAAVSQAEGVSLPGARRLLAVLLGADTPSVAKLGRFTQEAARRATALLAVLDEASRPLVQQAAADEIFAGRQPILMVVEQESLCWVSGRRVPRRDGATWAEEFRRLPNLVQVTRDDGTGLEKGLALVNQERCRQERPAVADQADHFHLLREGSRALRRLQGQTTRALEAAEKAQKELACRARRGHKRTGQASVASRQWRHAEAVMDRWIAAERAWAQVRQALPLFTPSGQLNTRAQAEAVVAAALPQLAGPEWAKVRRQLARPEMFTFLDRVQQELACLPVAEELRQAAVRAEGLRRQPGALAGGDASAGALRGVLLLAGVVLSLAGVAGERAVTLVRDVLRQGWRASSLVEGINSVLRMHQGRHRRLTQGLLDLKRLYWNCRVFRTGRRRRRSPYELLGVQLPQRDWWGLLKMTPEELKQQLSAPKVVA
jgi:hypothetical protein